MDYFTIYSNKSYVFLQPNKPNRSVLQITRPDGALSMIPEQDFAPSAFGPFDASFRCFGIYGMIDLLAGKYLILITERSLIGTIPGSDGEVRQVTGVEVVSCGKELSELDPLLRADEEQYLKLLLDNFHIPPLASGIYYSHGVELTRTLQAQLSEPLTVEQWKRDQSSPFCINNTLLQEFREFAEKSSSEILDFICVCIQGFVEIRELLVDQKRITFILISRRDVSRTGARYFSRGIDRSGKVSNFVETEQMFFTVDGRCASFVQIRGSIPLFWRQNVRIKYKPELEIVAPVEDNVVRAAFSIHRDELLHRYGRVSIANLVDQKGGEGQLAAAFRHLSDEEDVRFWRYVEFDFHHQCRNMAYKNIQFLVRDLSEELDSYGYFEGNYREGNVIRKQSGVVRTNCMDCLDRTNVVQSVLARRALICQMKDFEILSNDFDGELVLPGVFRNVWADNADAISTQYSGTGALKTDFTRTGQRSSRGALQDGINSVLRYYFGNFTDGQRQDSLDLLFGAFKTPDSAEYVSPFQNANQDPLKQLVIYALVLLIILFFAICHFKGTFSTPGAVMSFAGIIYLLHFMRSNGKRFVQYPRLNPPPLTRKFQRIARNDEKETD